MASFKETNNAAANEVSSGTGHLNDIRESNRLHRQTYRHKNTYATWLIACQLISQLSLVIMVQRPDAE